MHHYGRFNDQNRRNSKSPLASKATKTPKAEPVQKFKSTRRRVTQNSPAYLLTDSSIAHQIDSNGPMVLELDGPLSRDMKQVASIKDDAREAYNTSTHQHQASEHSFGLPGMARRGSQRSGRKSAQVASTRQLNNMQSRETLLMEQLAQHQQQAAEIAEKAK